MARIKAARCGQEAFIDAGGYDVLVLPAGATANGVHDGCKYRVFTKPDVRGSGSSQRAKAKSGGGNGKGRAKNAGSGGGSARGSGGTKGTTNLDAFQSTMDEYVTRTGVCLC